jgi:hypothetical protein
MSVNLDRFAQGLPDPQDIAPITFCEGCDGEIYPGEDVYVVDGCILHSDHECLIKYIDPEEKSIEEALGVK